MSRKYFIPYFGEHRVADMPDAFAEKYWDWRINFHKDPRSPTEGTIDAKGPPDAAIIPAQKTLKHGSGNAAAGIPLGEARGLREARALDQAAEGQTHEGRRTTRDLHGGRVEDDIRAHARLGQRGHAMGCRSNGGELHRRGPHTLHRYQRELLRNYLLFMANSGLRPNEARQLLWRDIRLEQDADDKPALVLEVSPLTKTGARTVVCREGTEVYLDRLKKISQHIEPGDYVFGVRAASRLPTST